MKRILSILFLSLTAHLIWAQSGAGYDPVNPPDPDVYYKLTLEAAPLSGGTVSPNSSQKLSFGQSTYVSASHRLGYKFKQWMMGDSLVSTNSSFSFTMPDYDVVLTAYFDWVGNEGYDPVNPGDPDAEGYSHHVYVYASPSAGGYFNSSSFTLVEGKTTSIYAYPREGYRFESWMCNGEVVSTDNPLTIKMGTADISYTATFAYNPVSPGEPSPNVFNAATGEVIIDNFTPGSLNSAIYAAVGSSDNYSLVQSITVIGRMQSSDFGFARSYRNCSLIDLSRTTGYTEIPSYSFDGAEALKELFLPINVENVGTSAFRGCSSLTDIYLYATTPPTLEENALEGLDKKVKLHVPSASVALYATAAGWNQLSIQSLDANEKSITVNLPGENGKYKNMTIELQNILSGQTYRCLVTDRTTYTFYGLMKNTSYNVYLKTAVGVVLGEISGVTLSDKDLNVNFTDIRAMQDVTVAVMTPDGSNVTSDVTITWLDEQGQYLRQGNKVTDLLTGTNIQYRLKLSKDLAMEYVQPSDYAYEVKEGDNEIVCTLSPIREVAISGCVKDAVTKQGISGATISITQTLNGKYSKTFIAKTDNQGNYTATAFNAPTTIAVSAFDYVNQIVDVAIDPESETIAVEEILMNSIIGATINISLTYTPSVAEGETAETQNWYSDYQNVAYNIYNVTTGKEVTQVSVRYPQFVILDGVSIGDSLEIKAVSKKNAFKEVPIGLKVNTTSPIDIVFPIKEFGGINSQYKNNENAEVVGMLYDGSGYLKKVYDYTSDTRLSISGLPDGNYTLVTMGKNSAFNSIYSLTRLKEILLEGVDYQQSRFNVESGLISTGICEQVPYFDENKFKYVNKDKSYFNVDNTSIVAGNYLTFTGHLETMDVNLTSLLGNVRYIVDLPPSAVFVENSVMIGGNIVNDYSLEGNTLTISCPQIPKDKVKFCVIPTESGTFLPSATVAFTVGDKETMLSIGCSPYEVKDLSISVPSTVAKTSILVSGTAIGTSNVEIYDNDVLIGQTTSLANGTWSTTCELNEPYNLSMHSIYAKIKTKTGVELNSETIDVTYDKNNIVPEKVTMLYYNPEFGGQYNIVFDLINGTVDPTFYYFFPYKNWPNWWETYETEPKDFTFVADLSNNDTTIVSRVTIRVYTDKGTWRNLEAKYDTFINNWMAISSFESDELPVGVDVVINANTEIYMDANAIEKGFEGANDFQEAIVNSTSQTDELSSKIMEGLNSGNMQEEELESLMDELLTTIDFTENVSPNEIPISDLLSQTENILGTDFSGLFSVDPYDFEELSKYLDGFSIEKREDLNEELLINEGFQSIKCSDGKEYYYKNTDDEYIVAYLPMSVYIVYNIQDIVNIASQSSGALRANDVNDLRSWQGKVYLLCDKLQSTVSAIAGLVDNVIAQVDALADKCTVQISENLGRLLEDAENPLLSQKEIDNLTKANVKLSKQLKQCKAISSWLKTNLKNFRISNGAGVAFSLFDIYQITNGIKDDGNKIIDLYFSVPDCPEDTDDDNLRNRIRNWGIGCFVFYAGKIAADIIQVNSVVAGVSGAIPTGGTSLSAVGIAVAIWAGSIVAEKAYSWQFVKNKEGYENEIRKTKCTCPRCGKDPCECCPKCGNYPCECKPPKPQIPPIHDPSGYVYEGVSSNRMPGVTATAYYMETTEDIYGVLHDEPRVWDAEEFDQENPLFTDENGFYQWFVPQGLWQVKFEKEGYETTYSEWLPVPPPQLDVNIAMTQSRQPEVIEAHAYKDGVEFSFDKYMSPAYLTVDNIMVSQNGEYVNGEVKLMDEETAYDDENVKYASRVRFIPETPFTAGEVTLLVSNRVRSYANIPMQDAFTQSFDIEKEIKEIVVDSPVKVPYEGTKTITVLVLPADASAGKTLHAESTSEMLATIAQKDVIISETGEAQFEVSGELPGSTSISFTIEGFDISASAIINIEQMETKTIAMPKSSIASGSSVYRGTTVTLTSDEEGMKIWYTLDGTCPCDENGTRKLYTEPLAINSDVIIKAISEDNEGDASDVATFSYSILQSKAGVALNNGWTWVSFNMKDEALASTNTALTSGTWTASDVIKDNQYVDMYSAAQGKWIGTMSKHGTLKNTGMYKIHSSQTQTLGLTGEAVHPKETTISVGTGWNYISYVPLVSISVTEALSGYEAQDGDVIKSQDAFATYSSTNGWEGDLTTLDAGKGYMLKRNTSGQTSFCYPIPSTSSTPSNARQESMSHRYADNMNIVGEIYGITVEDGDSLIAYVGGEVRGASRLVNGKKVFLTIHGDVEATVALVLQRDGEIIATASDMIGYKSNEVVGTGDAPTAIAFSSESHNAGSPIGNIKAIYSMNGMKMGTKRLNAVPAGAYIIYSETGGNIHITKLIKQ